MATKRKLPSVKEPLLLKRYLLMYCFYDPDNYVGHRIKDIKASSMAEAEQKAHELLNKLWIRTNFEYRIVEYVEDQGYRVFDTRTGKQG